MASGLVHKYRGIAGPPHPQPLSSQAERGESLPCRSESVLAHVPKIDSDYCCFRLRVGRSKIHRWGIYADEDIPARRKVIEYTGEKIGPSEAKRRWANPLSFRP